MENIRSQFRAIRGEGVTGIVVFCLIYHKIDPEDEENRNAEEAWMDNDPATHIEDGSSLDLYSGLCVGFLAGILSIVWVKEPGLFTRKQQLGIYMGLLLNVSFGLMRLFYF